MGVDIVFPKSDNWFVKSLRFCNVLDDAVNELSPTKINVWCAQCTTVATAFAAGFAWLHGHIDGIEHLWVPVATWMTHAMTAHHYDKKERNRAKEAQRVPAP